MAAEPEDGLESDLAIDVHGLVKRYGSLTAVDGLDLQIRTGEVFALLGPNGAGKTTTVEILEGYRSRDAGTVSVLGVDPQHHRAALKPRIGIVLQSTGIDHYLTVHETVQMYGGYYPAPRPTDEVIEMVGLTAKRNARVIKLSGGQQRRLDVAVALVGNPELLFLDEPTTGFDPSARHEAWSVVTNLAELGKTVVLTTHYMDEAQHLCDRVAIVSDGHVVALGTPESLGGRDAVRAQVRFRVPPGTGSPFGVAGQDGVVQFSPTDLTRDLHVLTGWALEHDVELDNLQISRPTLEDVYLQLTDGSRAGAAG